MSKAFPAIAVVLALAVAAPIAWLLLTTGGGDDAVVIEDVFVTPGSSVGPRGPHPSPPVTGAGSSSGTASPGGGSSTGSGSSTGASGGGAPTGAADGTAASLIAAARSGDAAATEAAFIRMRERLEADPDAAVADILEALARENDPLVLDRLAALLAGRPELLGDPEVLAALRKMASDDPNPDRRMATLMLLGQHLSPDQEHLDHIAFAAANDRDPDVRLAAMGALAETIRGTPELGADVNARLIALAASEGDAAVRASALGAIAGQSLDVAAIGRLERVLEGDGELGVRQVAAEVLGDAPAAHRDAAMSTLARGLGRESDYHVRRTMMTAIVRAGRNEAIPALERIVASGSNIADDAGDYLDGLRQGIVDMDRLWEHKQRRETERNGPGAVPGGGGDHDDH